MATDKVSEEHGAPAHGLAWRPGRQARVRVADITAARTWTSGAVRNALPRTRVWDYDRPAGEETASVPFAAMLRATEPDDPVRGVIEVSRPDDGLPLSRAGEPT
ncbi:hypothetical protein [Actinomadura sp. BRA 177]|uniref:hypothetical protein n=1 Tax=Actinomadura sp. BRA 177 TaxID=2745202 RepID=UPI0015955ED0|nr:hypothetical protein [Actinomadura sp. BRA 177]NVI92627.1 hypothetical protein [Actinomadura sp. BRA 177]